jgi:hypothetical protein
VVLATTHHCHVILGFAFLNKTAAFATFTNKALMKATQHRATLRNAYNAMVLSLNRLEVLMTALVESVSPLGIGSEKDDFYFLSYIEIGFRFTR